MNKIIFLDVDGTLINYHLVLPKSAQLAVDKARKNGHRIYLCTGCSKAELLQRHLCETDGMIGGNGAYVEDNNQVIYHKTLTKEEVCHIVDWCDERHLGLYLETNEGMFCNDEMIEQGSQVMIRYGQGKGADLLSAKKKATHFMNEMIHVEKKDLYRSDVNKISFILSSYQDHLDSKKEFADLEVNTWGGRDEEALFGDVGPKDITKKNAIDVLLSYLHADINDTIAFGDAKIDIEMIEYCHIGVAMGNSSQEVKDKADLVCDDVDHDGLYKAFVELGLIE